MPSTLENKMNLDSVSQKQSQQLEKCFYEMQSNCQNEIENIEATLFSPKMLVSENIDFKKIFSKSIYNLNDHILSAIRFYAMILMDGKSKESTTALNNDVIGSIIKEQFIDKLSIEINSLANLILSTINKPSLLHPTILIQYQNATQKIKDIRPSTLMELVNKIEI